MFGQNLATSELTVRGGQPKYLAAFRTELTSRLRSGSHLILHGPRGSGKSTLRASMRDDYHLHCIPCAIAPQTLGLPDVVTALSQAYPKTDLGSLGRRAIGVRLRIIADRSLTDTARVLFNGSRGLGEAYMLGCREAQDLDGFIYRLLTARLDERLRTWRDLAAFCVAPFVNLQQRSRAFQIGQRHYDIGNGRYGRFLLHTIGSVGSTNHTDPWLHKYIFPNSMIPSQHQIAEAIEGLFLIDGWQRMGSHYDRTPLACPL